MTDHPATPRAFDLATAETLATTWAARSQQIEAVCTPVREWLVAELAPQPGDTVLELAAGVGDTGFEISRIIGETGELITSDQSPAMLVEAERRGDELGIANVTYHVIDAERIELDDDSVDGVVCRFGYMLMPDAAAALAETRRVLRAGGRVVLAVWAAPERNPFFTTVAMSLVQRGQLEPPEPPPAPGIFSMASPERTNDLLSGAGFGEIRIEEVPVRFPVPNAEEYVDFVTDTAGPIAMALRGLSPDQRAAVVDDVQGGFAQFESADGYTVPGVVLCAVGTA